MSPKRIITKKLIPTPALIAGSIAFLLVLGVIGLNEANSAIERADNVLGDATVLSLIAQNEESMKGLDSAQRTILISIAEDRNKLEATQKSPMGEVNRALRTWELVSSLEDQMEFGNIKEIVSNVKKAKYLLGEFKPLMEECSGDEEAVLVIRGFSKLDCPELELFRGIELTYSLLQDAVSEGNLEDIEMGIVLLEEAKEKLGEQELDRFAALVDESKTA